jgi:hypothetical protein
VHHGARTLAWTFQEYDSQEGLLLDGKPITDDGAHALRDVLKAYNNTLRQLQIRDSYHDVQRQIYVYLDMNGAGRKLVCKPHFLTTCWPQFLVEREVLFDVDLMYLFL